MSAIDDPDFPPPPAAGDVAASAPAAAPAAAASSPRAASSFRPPARPSPLVTGMPSSAPVGVSPLSGAAGAGKRITLVKRSTPSEAQAMSGAPSPKAADASSFVPTSGGSSIDSSSLPSVPKEVDRIESAANTPMMTAAASPTSRRTKVKLHRKTTGGDSSIESPASTPSLAGISDSPSTLGVSAPVGLERKTTLDRPFSLASPTTPNLLSKQLSLTIPTAADNNSMGANGGKPPQSPFMLTMATPSMRAQGSADGGARGGQPTLDRSSSASSNFMLSSLVEDEQSAYRPAPARVDEESAAAVAPMTIVTTPAAASGVDDSIPPPPDSSPPLSSTSPSSSPKITANKAKRGSASAVSPAAMAAAALAALVPRSSPRSSQRLHVQQQQQQQVVSTPLPLAVPEPLTPMEPASPIPPPPPPESSESDAERNMREDSDFAPVSLPRTPPPDARLSAFGTPSGQAPPTPADPITPHPFVLAPSTPQGPAAAAAAVTSSSSKRGTLMVAIPPKAGSGGSVDLQGISAGSFVTPSRPSQQPQNASPAAAPDSNWMANSAMLQNNGVESFRGKRSSISRVPLAPIQRENGSRPTSANEENRAPVFQAYATPVVGGGGGAANGPRRPRTPELEMGPMGSPSVTSNAHNETRQLTPQQQHQQQDIGPNGNYTPRAGAVPISSMRSSGGTINRRSLQAPLSSGGGTSSRRHSRGASANEQHQQTTPTNAGLASKRGSRVFNGTLSPLHQPPQSSQPFVRANVCLQNPRVSAINEQETVSSRTSPCVRWCWIVATCFGLGWLIFSVIYATVDSGYTKINPAGDPVVLAACILYMIGLAILLLVTVLFIARDSPFKSFTGISFQVGLTSTMLGVAGLISNQPQSEMLHVAGRTSVLVGTQTAFIGVAWLFIVFAVWVYAAPSRTTAAVLVLLDSMDVTSISRDIRTLKGMNAELIQAHAAAVLRRRPGGVAGTMLPEGLTGVPRALIGAAAMASPSYAGTVRGPVGTSRPGTAMAMSLDSTAVVPAYAQGAYDNNPAFTTPVQFGTINASSLMAPSAQGSVRKNRHSGRMSGGELPSGKESRHSTNYYAYLGNLTSMQTPAAAAAAQRQVPAPAQDSVYPPSATHSRRTTHDPVALKFMAQNIELQQKVRELEQQQMMQEQELIQQDQQLQQLTMSGRVGQAYQQQLQQEEAAFQSI